MKRVLIFDNNLLWTSRLLRSLENTDYQGVLMDAKSSIEDAYCAILNLSHPQITDQVATLKEAGVPMIAHAGHKEKDLLELGKAQGCEILATNSEITNKLLNLLEKINKIAKD